MGTSLDIWSIWKIEFCDGWSVGHYCPTKAMVNYLYRATIKEQYNVGLNCDLILSLGEFLSILVLGAHQMCFI